MAALGGDVIQKSQLVEAEMQNQSQIGGLLVGRTLGKAIDQGIEGAATAGNAIHQLADQMPVGGDQAAVGQQMPQNQVGIGVLALDFLQSQQSQLARVHSHLRMFSHRVSGVEHFRV